MDDYQIRPMRENDIPKLIDIQPRFQTDKILRVEFTGESFTSGWQLVEVELDTPYDKGRGYDFNTSERENIRQRFAQNNTLFEVVIESATERIVGILDVEAREWNDTAWIWNIMLDKSVRGQGIGTQLMHHTIDWAKKRKLRAVMLETQTNNVPACRFYAKIGFKLVGINTLFYSNRDIERGEVAIFWGYPLD